MATFVPEVGNGTNISATTTIHTGACVLLGIFVSSSSSGILTVKDGSTLLVNNFTGVAGTFYRIPVSLATSLVITLVSGSIDCCVVWQAG